MHGHLPAALTFYSKNYSHVLREGSKAVRELGIDLLRCCFLYGGSDGVR